jgi:hypothetical protein
VNGKYAEAEAEFKAAIALDPQLYEACHLVSAGPALHRASAVQLNWMEQDSDWDAARDHPRFIAIVESLRSELKWAPSTKVRLKLSKRDQ